MSGYERQLLHEAIEHLLTAVNALDVVGGALTGITGTDADYRRVGELQTALRALGAAWYARWAAADEPAGVR